MSKLGAGGWTFAAALFLNGAASAAVLPFMGLLALDVARVSNWEFAASSVVGSLVSVLAAVVVGWYSDNLADRRIIIRILLIVGCTTYLALFLLPVPTIVLLCFAVLVPLSRPATGQIFALARAYANGRSDGLIPTLRSFSSAGWIVAPPAIGALAAQVQVNFVFGLAALMYLLSFAVTLRLPRAESCSLPSPQGGYGLLTGLSLNTFLSLCSVTLIRAGTFLHLTILPLLLTRKAHVGTAEIGLCLGLSALLEIPLLIFWGRIEGRFNPVVLLAVGAAIYGCYLVVLSGVTSWEVALSLQILNAIGYTAIAGIGLSYVQEACSRSDGFSTSLWDVTQVAALAISALAFAISMDHGGVSVTALVAASLCGIGAIGLILGRSLDQHQHDASGSPKESQ